MLKKTKRTKMPSAGAKTSAGNARTHAHTRYSHPCTTMGWWCWGRDGAGRKHFWETQEVTSRTLSSGGRGQTSKQPPYGLHYGQDRNSCVLRKCCCTAEKVWGRFESSVPIPLCQRRMLCSKAGNRPMRPGCIGSWGADTDPQLPI